MITEQDCMIKYQVAKQMYAKAIKDENEFDAWPMQLRGNISAYEEVLEIEPKTFK